MDYDLNEMSEISQTMFNNQMMESDLSRGIETDFNEIHAMYPFLQVQPPLMTSGLFTIANGSPIQIAVPDNAKIFRILTSNLAVRWSTSAGGDVTIGSLSGWSMVPANSTSGWFYCGNVSQLTLSSNGGIAAIEFASTHARI